MIDAHNHLDFDDFDSDRASVVAEARASGITGWIVAGTHPATWGRTQAVADATGGWAVLGVHPGWAGRVRDWRVVADALRGFSPLGVGEIGLDRRTAESAEGFSWQVEGMRAQLAVARELERPVVFHCVGAYPELLAVIRRDGLPVAGGFVHGWSGPPDRVAEALALGLGLSFGPAITAARAPRQVASARATPRDRLFVETDSPDQAPRGIGPRRGTPSDLVRVVAALAAARGEDVAVTRRATRDNTARLFGLGSP